MEILENFINKINNNINNTSSKLDKLKILRNDINNFIKKAV